MYPGQYRPPSSCAYLCQFTCSLRTITHWIPLDFWECSPSLSALFEDCLAQGQTSFQGSPYPMIDRSTLITVRAEVQHSHTDLTQLGKAIPLQSSQGLAATFAGTASHAVSASAQSFLPPFHWCGGARRPPPTNSP